MWNDKVIDRPDISRNPLLDVVRVVHRMVVVQQMNVPVIEMALNLRENCRLQEVSVRLPIQTVVQPINRTNAKKTETINNY